MTSSRLQCVLSRTMRVVYGLACAWSVFGGVVAVGAVEEAAVVQPGERYTYLGRITPRHARDIEASNWSIGAETMDRDFTIYASWRKYLGPLAVKKARIQSGWAKTEKQRGQYDWAWIDEIVPDMVDQGVEPWVCLCYGNPIYSGGGDTGLGGGLVASDEALAAWDRYVGAFVDRYKQHVDEWEIWNEPRTGRGKGAVQYAEFVIRTAETIRRHQPKAQILFAAGGSFDTEFAKQVLQHLKSRGKLHLVDKVIYHPYAYNPDERNAAAMNLRKIARSFAPHIDIRQGENGAPSQRGSFGAIANYDWTETRQAKWAVRRFLGDLGRDIPSSYFAICDMQYPSGTNYKGVLAVGDDKIVDDVKKGYRAIQHVTAIFDSTLTRITNFDAEVALGGTDRYSVFGYRAAEGGGVVTLWRHTDPPGKNPRVEKVALILPTAKFDEPVWIDLVSGRVFAVDPELVDRKGHVIRISNVPVYDSVVLLADRSVIERVLDTKAADDQREQSQPTAPD